MEHTESRARYIVPLTIGLISCAAGALFAAAPAQAQTSTSSSTSPACVALERNLGYGMSMASDIVRLQNFFFGWGYFTNNVTGPFGPRTFAAVRQFQRDHGIPATGFVGPLTRAALRLGCSVQQQQTPVIYSVSPRSGPVGTTVVIDGRGFTADNTVHFGGGVILHATATPSVAISCTNDSNCVPGIHQHITFTVPSTIDPSCFYSSPRCLMPSRETIPGAYFIFVENAQGNSNYSRFVVTPGSVSTAEPVLSSVQPSSAATGTKVMLSGSGFSEGMLLHFYKDGEPYGTSGLTVVNGSTATFEVPEWIGAFCHYNSACIAIAKELPAGSYEIAVEDADGTSNHLSFTVASSGTSTPAAPTLSSISPAAALTGEQVTLSGSGFSQGAVLHFYKDGQPYGTSGGLTIVNSSTATFEVPEWIGAFCHPGSICIMLAKQLPAGSYEIAIEDADGTSNRLPITIGTQTNDGGALSITGLDAPNTLPMGTTGTWTVHAVAPSSSGQLHYRVVWGDTPGMGEAIAAPNTVPVQTSATFTHSYRHAGTFTPVFTVTDDAGHSATVSATVTVTPWY